MGRQDHDDVAQALRRRELDFDGARGADQAITDAIDTHVQAEQHDDDDDDGSAGALAPVG
jgi:hypothetical protein